MRLTNVFKVCALTLAIALAGCPSEEPATLDGSSTPDTAGFPDLPTSDITPDSVGPDGAVPDVPAGEVCPAGHVALNFVVDDTANQTYAQGELIWTGSFAHDDATNIVTYATSWLPEEGPYPALYDDGPVSAGGHEPEGATAGDAIWGVTVCYLADQDRTFAYGLLNEELRWIWLGANGQLEVTSGTTGAIDVPGQTIPSHGFNDLRVTLDMAQIHPDYSVIDDTYKTYIKGTMNSWTPIQLLDDGQLGDETAGDGVFTYQHSLFLGKHDGLLDNAQEAQFVFVFAKGELDPDDGLEYKVDGDAVANGVSAEGNCDSAWQDLGVVLSLDSKGISMNTAAVMCSGSGPECSDTTPCPSGQECVSGSCVTAQCSDTNPCPSGETCVAGSCVTAECGPSTPCPNGQECVSGSCVTAPECSDTTPCPGDQECVAGTCVTVAECSPNNPCPGEQECLEGVCVTVSGAQPELVLVIPNVGAAAGGTTVELHGENFEDGLTVTFGGAEATVTNFTANLLAVTTPPGTIGDADVTVTNPGGKFATFPNGFAYVEGSAAPAITDITPTSGPTGGGTNVTINGSNFVGGATVVFGTQTAENVAVTANSITCTTPANPLGAVTVQVTNPSGQKATLTDAFTYTPALPTWGQLNGPLTIDAIAGFPATAIQGQVYEDTITNAAGEGFGITAEVGYGPLGSDPSVDDSGWSFVAATYSGDTGNDDLYDGVLTIPTAGTYAATLRFSVNGGTAWLYVDSSGADDGFQSNAIATVTVADAGALQITSVNPASVSPLGGQGVIVSGPGIDASCTLTVDGNAVTANATDGSIAFDAPGIPEGDVDVVVTCGSDSATGTLNYAGSWDGDLSEWPDSSKLAEIQDAASSTEWGADNVLHALHAATDGVNLYLGVAGKAVGSFGANAISVYIDIDSGNGSGVTNTSAVTDTNGAVDSAVAGILNITASGFGAEYVVASLDMGSYVPTIDDPGSSNAGWREFNPLDDLFWHTNGGVVASATSEGMEAWIPLNTLLGTPTGGSVTIGLIARVGNNDGTALSNQSLPLGVSGTNNEESTDAATFTFTY